MADLAVHRATDRAGARHSDFVSTPLAIVALFSLLGLAISAALLPLFASEEISWVISHLE